jgi:hypothetical protein
VPVPVPVAVAVAVAVAADREIHTDVLQAGSSGWPG